jgi:hypothetical protein
MLRLFVRLVQPESKVPVQNHTTRILDVKVRSIKTHIFNHGRRRIPRPVPSIPMPLVTAGLKMRRSSREKRPMPDSELFNGKKYFPVFFK